MAVREAGQPGRRQRSAHRPRRRGGRPARGQVLDAGLKRGAHRRLPLPAPVVGRAEGDGVAGVGEPGAQPAAVVEVHRAALGQGVVGLGGQSEAGGAAGEVVELGAVLGQLHPVQVGELAPARPHAGHGQGLRGGVLGRLGGAPQHLDLRLRLHHAAQAQQVGAVAHPAAVRDQRLPRAGGQRLALEADAGAGAVQQGQEGVGPRRVARAAEGLGHRLEPGRQVAGGPLVRTPHDDPVGAGALGVGRHLRGDQQGHLAFRREDGQRLLQRRRCAGPHHVLPEQRVNPVAVVGKVGQGSRGGGDQHVHSGRAHLF